MVEAVGELKAKVAEIDGILTPPPTVQRFLDFHSAAVFATDPTGMSAWPASS